MEKQGSFSNASGISLLPQAAPFRSRLPLVFLLKPALLAPSCPADGKSRFSVRKSGEADSALSAKNGIGFPMADSLSFLCLNRSLLCAAIYLKRVSENFSFSSISSFAPFLCLFLPLWRSFLDAFNSPSALLCLSSCPSFMPLHMV